jgi:hypothetical protein
MSEKNIIEQAVNLLKEGKTDEAKKLLEDYKLSLEILNKPNENIWENFIKEKHDNEINKLNERHEIERNLNRFILENKETAFKMLYDLEKKNHTLFGALYEKYKFDDFLFYVIIQEFDRINHFIERYNMNINHLNKDGQTFLMRSMEITDNSIILNKLLENGIDLSIIDKDGHDALYYAEGYKYIPHIHMIKEYLVRNKKSCETCGKK